MRSLTIKAKIKFAIGLVKYASNCKSIILLNAIPNWWKAENVKIYATTQPTDQNAKKNQQNISIRDETEFLFSKRESDDFFQPTTKNSQIKIAKGIKTTYKIVNTLEVELRRVLNMPAVKGQGQDGDGTPKRGKDGDDTEKQEKKDKKAKTDKKDKKGKKKWWGSVVLSKASSWDSITWPLQLT